LKIKKNTLSNYDFVYQIININCGFEFKIR